MPLQIVENDITKMKVDAIVNAANSSLLGGGGVDGCIHRAAGSGLLAECRTLGGCATGSAKVTAGYALPCKYVIHAVGPVWLGGSSGEEEKLRSCYTTALKLASERGCESIAFPLISSGIFGYPKRAALDVAVNAIRDFLDENEMLVYIVIYNRNEFPFGERLRFRLTEYISECLSTEADFARDEIPTCKTGSGEHMSRTAAINRRNESARRNLMYCLRSNAAVDEAPADEAQEPPLPFGLSSELSLEDALRQIDESFSEMLLRKIDESGMTDAECYKKANVDRKLFSKIRSDRLYKPSKTTAVAFALALELPIDEVREMLQKAGFALSHSNAFDIIVEYFVMHGNYNIFEINEALFAFDQKLIGA